MKNQRKQLIIMATFLVFLVIAYLGLDVYNDEQAKKEAEKQTVTIIDSNYEDVVAFSYDYNEDTYNFTKSENVWTYDAKPGFDVDESMVDEMLAVACALVAQDFLEEYESLDNYGLDEPQKTVNLNFSDGSTMKIQLGNYNDIVGYYYLMIEGDSNLYLVDSTLLDVFEVSYTSLEYVEEVTEMVETSEMVEDTEE